MAEFPAMPLWTDAYLGDTTHLTTIEHGAYLLLLMTMWRTAEKSLPNDDKLLARYARLTPAQWARMKPVIMEFLTVDHERVFQSRLTDEAVAVKRNSRRQSDKVKARWLKNKGNDDTAVSPGNTEAIPDAYQTDTSLTLNPIKEDKSSLTRDAREGKLNGSQKAGPDGYVWAHNLTFGENQVRAALWQWARSRRRPPTLTGPIASHHLREMKALLGPDDFIWLAKQEPEKMREAR